MNAGIVALVVVLMAVGLAGSILPIIPGTPLILLGALVYAIATDFEPVGWFRLFVLGALAALSYALEQLSSAFGARKFGGSGWAAAGALLGGIVGLFFGIFGILLGPVLGAVSFELLHRKELALGIRSGLGALVGILVGTVAKFSIAVVMVGLFAFWTLGT